MLNASRSPSPGARSPRIKGPSQVSLSGEALDSLIEATRSAADAPEVSPIKSESGSPYLSVNESKPFPLNKGATVADANELGLAKLSEIFQHPDDLSTKLALYRRKFAAEKSALDAQLSSLMTAQLGKTATGLENLQKSTGELDIVRGNLATIDGLCVEAGKAIAHYDKIQILSKTHQNVLLARNLLNQFQLLESELLSIAKALEVDKNKGPVGPANNILYCHCKLAQLSQFKASTLKKAAALSQEMLTNLQTFFRRFDALMDDFENYLWQLVAKLLDIVRKGHLTTVVHILKIVEVEEKLDEILVEQQQQEQKKLDAERQQQELLNKIIESAESAQGKKSKKKDRNRSASTAAKGQSGLLAQDSSYYFGGGGLAIGTGFGRVVKSYRSTMFDILHEAIANQFALRWQPLEHDLMGTLAVSSFVIDDLTLVFDEMVACFPKKYNIFSFYVAEYHLHVYTMVAKYTSSAQSLEASEILALMRWVRNYHQDMLARLGVADEMLEPRLLIGDEDKLVNRYLMLMRSKIQEWLQNLLKFESKLFLERTTAPETDSDGLYMMQAPVIVFQILNQQIDVVSTSDRGNLLYQVVLECFQTFESFQQAWVKLLNDECARWITDAAMMPLGLPEWICALANDQMRCTDNVEVLKRKVEILILESYRSELAGKFSRCVDGFMLVSKRSVTTLVDFIMADCLPAWSRIHMVPEWYEQDLVKLLIGTMSDYLGDYQQSLNDYLFQKLTTELMERVLLTYLETFRAKGIKFKMNVTSAATSASAIIASSASAGLPSQTSLLDNPSAALEEAVKAGVPIPASLKIKADIYRLSEFFCKYKPQKRVNAAFDPLTKISNLVSSTPRLVFLDFYALWKSYPDVQLSFVESILKARDDMEKSVIKEVMENCKKKMAEETAAQAANNPNANATAPYTTIFSQLPK